jgi:hypothetical protein
MKNRLISVLAGIATGWIVVTIGEIILHKIFPLPVGINFIDKIVLTNYINSLHAYYFLCLLFIWAVSAFGGGAVSGKLGKQNWKRVCIITGVVLLIGNVANFIMIPHPLWVNIISVILYLPVSYLGAKLMNRKAEYV